MNIKDYVEKIKQAVPIKGIYLFGSYGVGKTHTMKQLQKFAVKKININSEIKKYSVDLPISSYLISWPSYISDLKSNMSDNSKNLISLTNLKETEILIIDDIGGEMTSEWNLKDILFPILDYRYEKRLFTCFTSNFNIQDLRKHWKTKIKDIHAIDRVIERMIGMTTEQEMIGKNWRHEKIVFKYL